MISSESVVALLLILLLLIALIFSLIPLSKKDTVGPVLLKCEPGLCATSLVTGVKRCPSTSAGVVERYIEFEVCNSPSGCENPTTPYAVQADLSTNSEGICEPGVSCRCSRGPACPYYISTSFISNNGNPFEQGSRFYYSQLPYSSQPNSSPLTTSSGQQCTIPFLNLRRAFDSCNMDFSSPAKAKESFASCASSRATCLSGTLALYPNDPNHYSEDKLFSYDVACLALPTVDCQGKMPAYNKELGKIVCL